jgi:predicted HTH transcriptional regulator
MNTLSKRQKQILKVIYTDNTISRAGISEIIHINESAIQKHLNTLKEKGFLKRVGGTRGYWQTDLEKN